MLKTTAEGRVEPRKLVLRPKPDRRSRPRIAAAEIARRAFEIYEARGGADGHDFDDWLRAERELLALAMRATGQ